MGNEAEGGQMDVAYLDLLKKCLTASIYDESAWTVVQGPMSQDQSPAAFLKRKVVSFLNGRGLKLVRISKLNHDSRERGNDWPLFGFTMVGNRRLDNLKFCLEQVVAQNVPGDFVETGVWRGGSSIWAAAVLCHLGAKDRLIWCCDSFEGMPKPNATDLEIQPTSDLSEVEFLVATETQVADNFRKFGLLNQRVKFIKGWFCDSLPKAPIKQIAVLRMDGDLYESTSDALNNLFNKVSPGGFVIVDDYKSWKGCRKAIDEFRAAHAISAPLIDIDDHGVFWRNTSSIVTSSP